MTYLYAALSTGLFALVMFLAAAEDANMAASKKQEIVEMAEIKKELGRIRIALVEIEEGRCDE